MKITFLGSSHGVPSDCRFCSCTMIETNGFCYFIDAGAPIYDLFLRSLPASNDPFKRADCERIRAVFTTHAHGDHVGGLVSFVDLTNWFYTTVSPTIVVTEDPLIGVLKSYVEITQSETLDCQRIRFRVWDELGCYQDENIKVTPIPTCHMAVIGKPAYALKVECEGKTVVFTGDMSHNLAYSDFPDAAGADLLVSEMAHFSPAQVKPHLEKCTAKRVIFNHVFPLDKLEAIAAMDGQYAYPVSYACDGDIVEL